MRTFHHHHPGVVLVVVAWGRRRRLVLLEQGPAQYRRYGVMAALLPDAVALDRMAVSVIMLDISMQTTRGLQLWRQTL